MISETIIKDELEVIEKLIIKNKNNLPGEDYERIIWFIDNLRKSVKTFGEIYETTEKICFRISEELQEAIKEKKELQDILNGIETKEETKIRRQVQEWMEYAEKLNINK